MANREMEFLWRPSQSSGAAQQVFTGANVNHYSAPSGFNFADSNTEPIMDRPELGCYNVDVCEMKARLR